MRGRGCAGSRLGGVSLLLNIIMFVVHIVKANT
jgi:hypothetical protein